MGNDDDLIRRLRDFADGTIVDDPHELCRRAADALEESNLVIESMMEGVRRARQIRGKGEKE